MIGNTSMSISSDFLLELSSEAGCKSKTGFLRYYYIFDTT